MMDRKEVAHNIYSCACAGWQEEGIKANALLLTSGLPHCALFRSRGDMPCIHGSQPWQCFGRDTPEREAPALHQTKPNLCWRAQFTSLQVSRCDQENYLHHPWVPIHRLCPRLDPGLGTSPAFCRRHECHHCGLELWGNNSHLQPCFQKLQKSCWDSEETDWWDVGKLNAHTMIQSLMHHTERAQRKWLKQQQFWENKLLKGNILIFGSAAILAVPNSTLSLGTMVFFCNIQFILYISGHKTLQVCFPIHRNSISTLCMAKSQLVGIHYSLHLL